MTVKQVKNELKEIRDLSGAKRDNLQNDRFSHLLQKYNPAVKKLEAIEQLIYSNRILQRKSYYQVGQALNYSEETIRKKWNKILKKLAKILKPKTNYDKITASVDALAEMIVQMSLNCDFIPCYYAPDGTVFAMDKEGAIQYTIEWLQKECEDESV